MEQWVFAWGHIKQAVFQTMDQHVPVMVLASHTRHCYVCDVGSKFHLGVTHDMFSHHLVEGLADHVS
jgi:hypothetical protein